MTIPFVAFLSDYGLTDDFVGICHGVIGRICPDARVIDLTHGVPRHDVRAGAVLLAESLPYVPADVHLAIVDPGVGGQRRAVALQCGDGRRLVGPDNGLLWLAAEASGGVLQAADIARSRFALEPVSSTFHGRDLFAPVAAQLAAGRPVAETGDPLDPGDLVTLTLPGPRRDGDTLVASVRYVDRFGNLQLNATPADLSGTGLRLGRPAILRLADGATRTAPYVRTFADVGPGELLVYEDASRRLALAVAHGDAARALGLAVDEELELRGAVIASDATGELGLPRLHLRVVDSTNTRARELAAAGAPHGMLVTAGEQRAGRGRQGRTWSAPAGRALLCSLILRDPPRLLPLLAGVVVAEVADLAGLRAQVKWPNDVLVDGRKVAGILVEGRPQQRWAVLGIGVNVALRHDDFPPELRATAATLGRDPRDVEHTLASVLEGLTRWLRQSPETVLDAVRARDALRGRRVTWSGGVGTGDGIDADGRLVIRAGDGRRVALDAGEVHLSVPAHLEP